MSEALPDLHPVLSLRSVGVYEIPSPAGQCGVRVEHSPSSDIDVANIPRVRSIEELSTTSEEFALPTPVARQATQSPVPNAEVGSPSASQSAGCYVATAVYGSYDAPEVQLLRKFRDETLMPNCFGRGFVRFYYVFSPVLVKYLGGHAWFARTFRPALDRLVTKISVRTR